MAALGALAAGAAAALFYLAFVRDLPDFRSLADYRPPLTSVVLDRHGTPIGEFYEFRRRVIPLEQVPIHVVQAFIAAEDDTFFEHSGVDYVSIVRAAWRNLVEPAADPQGASTITQQIVKQLLLSPERTYRRKMREMLLARRIEQRFSKEEILYLYLNQIYFGSGAYGDRRGRAHLLREGGGQARRGRGRAARRPAEGAEALLAVRQPGARRGAPPLRARRACSKKASSTRRRIARRNAPPKLVTPVSEASLARRLLHRGGAAPARLACSATSACCTAAS